MVVATMPGEGAVTNVSANGGTSLPRRSALKRRDLVLDVLGVEVAHLADGLRRVGDLAALGEAAQEHVDQLRHLLEVLADLALGFAAEARHALGDVGLEADALLLAVVADVDAGRDLRVDDRCARRGPSPRPWSPRRWPRRPRGGSAGRSARRCAAGCRRAWSGCGRGCCSMFPPYRGLGRLTGVYTA